jgi:hypothetical protein
MTTFNEMLLQSHDGIIRVFPALPEAWQDANFKLRAVGAFVVTATRKTGKVRPLLVQSLKGGTCRLENPWPQDRLSVRELASRRLLPVKANAEIAECEVRGGFCLPDLSQRSGRDRTRCSSGPARSQPSAKEVAGKPYRHGTAFLAVVLVTYAAPEKHRKVMHQEN